MIQAPPPAPCAPGWPTRFGTTSASLLGFRPGGAGLRAGSHGDRLRVPGAEVNEVPDCASHSLTCSGWGVQATRWRAFSRPDLVLGRLGAGCGGVCSRFHFAFLRGQPIFSSFLFDTSVFLGDLSTRPVLLFFLRSDCLIDNLDTLGLGL